MGTERKDVLSLNLNLNPCFFRHQLSALLFYISMPLLKDTSHSPTHTHRSIDPQALRQMKSPSRNRKHLVYIHPESALPLKYALEKGRESHYLDRRPCHKDKKKKKKKIKNKKEKSRCVLFMPPLASPRIRKNPRRLPHVRYPRRGIVPAAAFGSEIIYLANLEQR